MQCQSLFSVKKKKKKKSTICRLLNCPEMGKVKYQSTSLSSADESSDESIASKNWHYSSVTDVINVKQYLKHSV